MQIEGSGFKVERLGFRYRRVLGFGLKVESCGISVSRGRYATMPPRRVLDSEGHHSGFESPFEQNTVNQLQLMTLHQKGNLV